MGLVVRPKYCGPALTLVGLNTKVSVKGPLITGTVDHIAAVPPGMLNPTPGTGTTVGV